jgi:hypothetical protein
MASQVEIVNLAAVELGDEIIMSMSENTKLARVMSVLWDSTLKECLSDHTWGFARERATLALLTAVPPFGFANAFQLPSDYVRMVYMGEPDDEYIWQIEGDKLLTDEGTAEITYVKLVTDTTKFSGKFVTALALLLAARAANSIAGMDTAKRDKSLAAYEKSIMDAATVDSQNSTPRTFVANRWIYARS